jgi:hypothetical protein
MKPTTNLQMQERPNFSDTVIERRAGEVGADLRADGRSGSGVRVPTVDGSRSGGVRGNLGGGHQVELVADLIDVVEITNHRLEGLTSHPGLGDQELGGFVRSSSRLVEPRRV